MKRSKGFTLIELLVVISIIALLIGILLPALGAARRAARQMKSTTQVRGIVQGLVTYAGGNKERMPGTNSKGYISYDLDDELATTVTGATVEGRYFLMLDANNFSGDYIISPSETKTVWTTNKFDDISTDNYSFAMLNIDSGATPPTTSTHKFRPDQNGRAREWKQSINTQAVLLTDRGRHSSGTTSNYDEIYSINTSEDDEDWAGSVGRGDGSASFENEDGMDTKYGSSSNIEADRLFTVDQDSPDFDIISDGTITWAGTMEENNALMGYEGVGFTESTDGEVVSK